MTEQEVTELEQGLMTEQEVKDKSDLWLTKLSKYIISRSSKLVSSDTQKDGRTLLFLSTLSSLFYIGLVKFEEYSSSGIKFSLSNEGAFIPIVIEFVCIYFAISFFIDAYSELKIWQFKTLIKNSDDEAPSRELKREKDDFIKKGEEIVKKYKEKVEKATEEHEIELPDELPPDNRDINQIKEYIDKIEARNEKQIRLMELINIYFTAQDIELQQLDTEIKFWDFKIKSFNMEILPIMKIYKFKHFINFVFPLLAFVISIAALIFYFVRHR